MNPKEFIVRWVDGMKNLPQLELLKAQRAGIIGNIIGFAMAFIWLLFSANYIWLLVLACTEYLQVLDLIKVSQQIRSMKTFDENLVMLNNARL